MLRILSLVLSAVLLSAFAPQAALAASGVNTTTHVTKTSLSLKECRALRKAKHNPKASCKLTRKVTRKFRGMIPQGLPASIGIKEPIECAWVKGNSFQIQERSVVWFVKVNVEYWYDSCFEKVMFTSVNCNSGGLLWDIDINWCNASLGLWKAFSPADINVGTDFKVSFLYKGSVLHLTHGMRSQVNIFTGEPWNFFGW